MPSLCVVCGAASEELYRQQGPSISSTARLTAAPTVVSVCTNCAHIQSEPLPDIAAYYDNGYNAHLESSLSDDLYGALEGRPLYRAEHQAAVAVAKLDLAPGATVLDYGCSKGATLREMHRLRPDLALAAFDVSDNYRPYWAGLIEPENQAMHEVPASWERRFDAVLTFFALEHAAEPRIFLAQIRRLLKPGGILHLVIPNVRQNTGDFIVVDHVNHFMPSSLRLALAAENYADVDIDEDAHTAAYVVDAVRSNSPAPAAACPGADVARFASQARGYARYWRDAGEAVRTFERDRARGRKSAIYGSGFYGVFIASQLTGPIAHFLDQSTHQQAKRIFERPVIAPEAIGDDVEVVYVGLNPSRSREIIATVPSLHRRERDYFFFL